MSSRFIYCVYLTSYSGNLLPPFYIGSTNISRINSGYKGSVTSKRYSGVWKREIKENPHLFKTIIISKHLERKEALAKEYKLQKALNVVKNVLYINQSLATENGFFGMDTSGKNHPLYGIGHTENARKNISKNHADVSGNNNPRARIVKITTDVGEDIICHGNLRKVCRELNLSYATITLRCLKGFIPKYGNCKGYTAEYLF